MIRNLLVGMTFIAVVSDYVLHPFYPKFFSSRFGVTDPEWTGYYFSAMCFMVMISFPFWAFISKKISELNILIYTQCMAGILALGCFTIDTFSGFWVLSLVMILFKASYLLVYPFILRIIQKEEHTSTIGLLSVIVHLGGILGAVIGGVTVDLIDAGYVYLIMAIGDFVQMGLTIYLRIRHKEIGVIDNEEQQTDKAPFFGRKGIIFKIGLVTLILYFSDFLIRPFFVSYWENVVSNTSAFFSGLAYAIPGFVALVLLIYDHRRKNTSNWFQQITVIIVLGLMGLVLQGIHNTTIVIIGRILYGWSIYRAMVKFDVILFEKTHASNYAIAYSKVHFFQNLGVLVSSFSMGILVEHFGFTIQFHTAAIGFGLTIVCYYIFFQLRFNKSGKYLVKY